MIKFTIILILLLLVIAIGLLIWRIHQYNQPRTIQWQIGHQVFTFQFPFKWMNFSILDYFKNILALIGAFVLGILILAAVLFFLFLMIGFLLPIILIIVLVVMIAFLLFII